jgi:hypothetical protein
MASGIKSWLINVICGLLAYTGSRFLWAEKDTGVNKLHWELLTFAVFYLILQALIRGRKLARKGREA